MIIAGLAVLGLCLGSFVNALVYRLHWQETHRKAPQAQKEVHSISNGRSICPNCSHRLGAKDLIPVFSWLALRGRCRYCQKPISWQYPVVEGFTALMFVLSYLFWPFALDPILYTVVFTAWLILLAGFVALAIYDIKYMILPNKIIFPLYIVALIGVLFGSIAESDTGIIQGALIGLIIGGGLFYLLFQVSGGAWIGGGDVKLGFLLGFILGGPWPALLLLFLASLLGTVYSIAMMAAGRVNPRSRLAFGPFLIVAAIIVELFGGTIIDWYNNLTGSVY